MNRGIPSWHSGCPDTSPSSSQLQQVPACASNSDQCPSSGSSRVKPGEGLADIPAEAPSPLSFWYPRRVLPSADG